MSEESADGSPADEDAAAPAAVQLTSAALNELRTQVEWIAQPVNAAGVRQLVAISDELAAVLDSTAEIGVATAARLGDLESFIRSTAHGEAVPFVEIEDAFWSVPERLAMRLLWVAAATCATTEAWLHQWAPGLEHLTRMPRAKRPGDGFITASTRLIDAVLANADEVLRTVDSTLTQLGQDSNKPGDMSDRLAYPRDEVVALINAAGPRDKGKGKIDSAEVRRAIDPRAWRNGRNERSEHVAGFAVSVAADVPVTNQLVVDVVLEDASAADVSVDAVITVQVIEPELEQAGRSADDEQAGSSGEESGLGGSAEDARSRREISRVMTALAEHRNALLQGLQLVCESAAKVPRESEPYIQRLVSPPRRVTDGVRGTVASADEALAGLVKEPGEDALSDAAPQLMTFSQALHEQLDAWFTQLDLAVTALAGDQLWRPGHDGVQALFEGAGQVADAAAAWLAVAQAEAEKLAAARKLEITERVPILTMTGWRDKYAGSLVTAQLRTLSDPGLDAVRQRNYNAIDKATNRDWLDWWFRIDGPDDVLVLVGASHPDELYTTCTKVPGGLQVIRGASVNLGPRVRSFFRALNHGRTPNFKGEVIMLGAPPEAHDAIRRELTDHGRAHFSRTAKEIRFDPSPITSMAPDGGFDVKAVSTAGTSPQHRDPGERPPSATHTWTRAKTFAQFWNEQVRAEFWDSSHAPMDDFRAYLEEQQAEENLDFLQDVLAFTRAKAGSRGDLADRIYETYFDIDKVAGSKTRGNPAGRKLRIDSAVKEAIEETIQPDNPAGNVFDAAKRQVEQRLAQPYLDFRRKQLRTAGAQAE